MADDSARNHNSGYGSAAKKSTKTTAKSSGYQTGTAYSSKTAPKSGTGGSKGLLGSGTSTAYGGVAKGGLLSGTGGNKTSLPAGALNPGGRSSFQKGTNLSSADLLSGGYKSYQQPPGYSNPAIYSPGTPYGTINGLGGKSTAFKGINLSPTEQAARDYAEYRSPPSGAFAQPTPPQFAAGNSPYPQGQTVPPMSGDFPQADPARPISRVAGGKGVQPYAPIGNSYRNDPVFTPGVPFKDQAQVGPAFNPGGYTQQAYAAPQATPESRIALDPSIPGRAMAASRSLFAGGVPGGYGMQPYDNPAYPSPANGTPMQQASAPEPINELYGSVQDGTGQGLPGGEGVVPPSTNPVTNTARRIAERLSGPLAKADQGLGQMFPGMSATAFGSNVDPFRIGGGGDILSNGNVFGNGTGLGIGGNGGGNNGDPSHPPVDDGTTPPPVTPPPTPLPPLFYPPYTSGPWANLPVGAYPRRII